MTTRSSGSRGLVPAAAIGLTALAFTGTAGAGQLDALESQLHALSAEVAGVKARQGRMLAAAGAGAAERSDDGRAVTVMYKPGLQIESADKRFTAHLGGRIMVDSAWYDEDKSRLGDGTEVRRGRLFLEGTMERDWAYKFQFDFVDSGAQGIRDAYIKYKGLSPVTVTVGNFKVPFSLQQLTSTKYTNFMERALPDAFAPGRRIGAGADAHGDNWTVAGGLYGDTVDGDVAGEGNEPWEVGGRVTFAPLHEKGRALHLGAAAGYADPNDDTVRFRQRPESHVTGARFVDTGTLGDVETYYRAGAEAALVYGPVSVQGEYLRLGVDRRAAGDLTLDGWYAEASTFLTGESLAYNPRKGAFGRLKPKRNLGDGGLGAWQLAVRYSTIDLSDADVRGGEEDNVTVGLNWHVNPYIRFMVNLTWVDNDEEATGNAANLLAGAADAGDDDPLIAQVRAQIDF